jgi:hypothetical protein
VTRTEAVLPLHADWCRADWPAPRGVHAVVTTRAGGASRGAWGDGRGGGGLNVGLSCGDVRADVLGNRARLAASLPAAPRWLKMVHGTDVVDAAARPADHALPVADAAFATRPGVVCCVTVADCLPVFLCDARGRGVAVAHAGWRGLAAGVIQHTVVALRGALADDQATLLAWLGPAIGPDAFEVGPEVRAAMRARLPWADQAFAPSPSGGDRLHADLFALARQALAQQGVHDVWGGGLSTHAAPQRFYSFRRDGTTGRHAALAWLDPTTSRAMPR